VADNPLDRSRAYVAAGVLFFDETGRVLLVQATYRDHRDIPGGYVDAGETPAQAAVREIREELGLEVAVGPLLVADWAPHPDEGDKLLFIFDGGTLTAAQIGAIRLPTGELASYAFHGVAEAVKLLVPRLSRRLGAAVEARRAGHIAYLEHGTPHNL
jgi:8-oxo-dGTP diphosphatase